MPYIGTTNKYIRKTNRGGNKKTELQDQKWLAKYVRKHRPDVIFHSDYAAGLWLSAAQSMERKSLQSGAGWPDIFFAYPAHGFAGLFLELKKEGTTIYVQRGSRKGELSKDEQIVTEAAILERLNALGYCARFACGRDKMKAVVDWYFGIESEPQTLDLF